MNLKALLGTRIPRAAVRCGTGQAKKKGLRFKLGNVTSGRGKMNEVNTP
jgi:hypothetical protein